MCIWHHLRPRDNENCDPSTDRRLENHKQKRTECQHRQTVQHSAALEPIQSQTRNEDLIHRQGHSFLSYCFSCTGTASMGKKYALAFP